MHLFAIVRDYYVFSWKDKILDYEIEIKHDFNHDGILDETWKDKILDYEIEIFA